MRDKVCREAEHVDTAFAEALGGNLSVGIVDARVQVVKEKEGDEHAKLQLGPDKGLFLLCQRVIFKMAAGGMEFAAVPARCLALVLQRTRDAQWRP